MLLYAKYTYFVKITDLLSVLLRFAPFLHYAIVKFYVVAMLILTKYEVLCIDTG